MANHRAHGNPRLEARQKAREMLLAGHTVKEIAKTIGVDPSSVYAWRKQPEFARRMAAAQEVRLALASDKLKSLTDRSLEFVAALLDDTKAPHAVRLKAATEVWDRAGLVSKAEPTTVVIERKAPTDVEMAAAMRYLEDSLKKQDGGGDVNGGGDVG